MPLRLIECVLPWLVGSMGEEEARSFLYNMHMAGTIQRLFFIFWNFISLGFTLCRLLMYMVYA